MIAHSSAEVDYMRYIVAWMLGVPFSVIAVWYVLGHAACGR
jgi:heme/copper-type cytochrome/quinol oxidase subunit 4